MRIIAGQRRGHSIEGLPGRQLRPTSDLVREAIFNILRDDVEGRDVLDLFAGTGALGLEALSRGASHVIFVERNRRHAALIRKNLSALRYEDRGTVVTADAFRWAENYEPLDNQPALVFLDPPYEEYEKRPQRVRQLLHTLERRLPAGSILVVESGRPLTETVLDQPELWDVRRYGSTVLSLRTLGPTPSESADEAEPAAER
jgi:16S rRNA (guanine966-N2)-methyltransferase